MPDSQQSSSFRDRLHEVIFEADTPTGRFFDVVLLSAIVLSVLVVMLESVQELRESHGRLFIAVEWFFTVLFTVEYVLRLYSVRKPLGYARSFFGIVDLISILPTYLGLFIPGAQSFLVVRSLRLLRVFRVLKLVRFVRHARALRAGLRASMPKITVFLFTVLTVVVIVGTMMYLVEGEDAGFTSIPMSVYWAIVTMTTVGYGDIAPATVLGRALAATLMILGYGVIAVPTGIVSVELSQVMRREESTRSCSNCSASGHDYDAKNCKHCGAVL